MNFTSPRAAFFLVTGLYLVCQVYLFHRARGYIGEKIVDRKRAALLIFGAAGFLILMFVPLVSMIVYGLVAKQPYPWFVRPQIVLFAIWALGSTGSALLLIGYEFARHAMTGLRLPATLPNVERREFLKTGLGAIAAAPFVLSGYGALMERRRFEIEYFEFPLDGLSGALHGSTIVQLTDIHVGPFMPGEELSAYVEAINRLEPDFVALTGDFIAGSPTEVAPCVDALSRLRAKRGIYACLGNHDAYAGIEDEITRLFAENNIRMLRNDAVAHRIGNSSLNVLGIDDLKSGEPDLSRALAAAQASPGEVRLLLSHRPEIFPTAAANGIEMVLSGHYHGGQVKLGPEAANLSIARLLTPYVDGLYRLPRNGIARRDAKSSTLFVGRGIGITGLPVRINCPPQIAHLTLKKA